MIKICLRCNKEFRTHPSEIKKGAGKYCSRNCFNPPMIKICLNCSKKFRIRPAKIKNNRGKYCSRKCRAIAFRGIIWNIKGLFKKGHIPWSKGKKNIFIIGKNNVNWKGGVTSEAEKIRKSSRYKDWRKAVFERDNYTCQLCRKRGGKLNADHIKSFSLFPELRLVIENGRTLCLPCHKLTPSYLNFPQKI